MDLIGFGYAALLTFGSILGYKRRGGVPSLIAGLFIGFLAFYGACRVSIDKRDVKLSLFTAFFLATIMGVRYKRSKKIMPAGLVAGLRERKPLPWRSCCISGKAFETELLQEACLRSPQ
ncbi:transmembrane protein 14A isoform X2 [Manis pentadactyla]|uniref:transmembrane protein 14A isoform X2 n=1 Tax=Manis pentadactyla TaxID=143292 RepID=UPI00255CB59B|nr:transmembrane protein 14A isoform X2 [Manis pentadactyla]